MNWLLASIICIILIEFVVRIPLPSVTSDINTVVRKALRILGAKSVSDHWKEKVILSYAATLFLSTLKLTGLLLAIGAVAVLLISTFDYFGAEVGNFLISWAGILFTIVMASAYFTIRKMLV
jgi:hypothetical protein